MRDHDRRPALHDVVQGRVHQPLALRVQRGGGLVEEQRLGIDDDGPGDCDSLLLPAAQLDPPLADPRVQAVVEAADEIRDVRALERAPHLVLRRVWSPESGVGADAPGEQNRLLAHDADDGVQVHVIDVRHRDAPDRDDTAGGLVKSHDERRDRALPGARRADDGDGVTGGNVEVESPQDTPLRV